MYNMLNILSKTLLYFSDFYMQTTRAPVYQPVQLIDMESAPTDEYVYTHDLGSINMM